MEVLVVSVASVYLRSLLVTISHHNVEYLPCCKLFNVSAASRSSADRPDRTLAALCFLSWSISSSIASGLVMSNDLGLFMLGENGGG